MTKLIECIPNFSEARRPEIVDQIVAAVQSVPQARVLDRSSDTDHNRTVLTFAGSPEAVEEAAFRAIKVAAELIDLDQHTGAHPRMGATDVCPFVPLSGATMADCVAIAQRLGDRVARELNIPVYLYEAAATRPDRANLENIRRGQYEGIKAEIETNPDRKPDYGPAKLGKAGATVIGARAPLIAFNVYLTTDEVDIAKKIAKVVRASSGGFRYVKGAGFLVDGRAQVSMNLTNFRETSMPHVLEAIRREAERYGVAIHHSELVGLIPQEALIDSAVWYMQMDQFTSDQILEQRLFANDEPSTANRQPATIEPANFLTDLASGTPAPGGGSAAAYAGAMGAALVAMVARLTIGKKKYAEVESMMNEILAQAESLRADLTNAVAEDAAAFDAVMQAFKLPKDDAQARADAIEKATLFAAQVPLRVAQKAVTVMSLAERAAAFGNLNAISDASSGAAMARACLTAAGWNVRINVESLQEKTQGESLLNDLARLESHAAKLEDSLRMSLKNRAGLNLK
jgi:glutamate formiminotransferase/formiminotetrahydrofolate cyclodeaminase